MYSYLKKLIENKLYDSDYILNIFWSVYTYLKVTYAYKMYVFKTDKKYYKKNLIYPTAITFISLNYNNLCDLTSYYKILSMYIQSFNLSKLTLFKFWKIILSNIFWEQKMWINLKVWTKSLLALISFVIFLLFESLLKKN